MNRIYDATLFKNKPAAGTGMHPIARVAEAQMVNGDFSKLIDRPADAPVYMDAEFNDDALMVKRLQEVHTFDAGARVGTYAVYPARDYWRAIAGAESVKYQKWVAENELRMEAGKKMDIIMPSLYTFYPDQSGWLTQAETNIREAMKYGREIMPFLWFDFHDASATPGVYIGDDYWRLQIQTCLDLTGNCIIWGGWDLYNNTGALPWNDNAAWYQVVKEFLTTGEQNEEKS